MQYLLKFLLASLLLSGCSTSTLDFFKSTQGIRTLTLPSIDRGYRHLQTRVITSSDEYTAFLHAIDAQENWDHKVAFGMTIAKAQIDFTKENLLIYRHMVSSFSKAVVPKILSIKENHAVILLEEQGAKSTGTLYQAFFYTVSKKITQVTFKSKQRVVTVKNSKQTLVIPKECIAWFDGCNHCIRAATGRALCTKRYCKKRGEFCCVKWQ